VVLVKAAPTRMLHANVLAYKIIAARAERGLGLDLFLRMQRDAHEAMQPAKDEAKRDAEAPIRPVFVRARPGDASPAAAESPAVPPQGDAPLTIDGQVYE